MWHLLLEMFMGRGNSCLSLGDFCSHQQSTSRESAGSGQEPKSQVNYPHHFFASLLPPSIFYWIQTLHPGGRFGLFSIQLFFHYSGFNLGFNLLYCPLFGTVGVGACMLQCRQPKSHGFSQPFHRAGWGCTYTIWCPSI